MYVVKAFTTFSCTIVPYYDWQSTHQTFLGSPNEYYSLMLKSDLFLSNMSLICFYYNVY